MNRPWRPKWYKQQPVVRTCRTAMLFLPQHDVFFRYLQAIPVPVSFQTTEYITADCTWCLHSPKFFYFSASCTTAFNLLWFITISWQRWHLLHFYAITELILVSLDEGWKNSTHCLKHNYNTHGTGIPACLKNQGLFT